jgi:hypothetical protein
VQRVDCGAYLTSPISSDDPLVRARALRGGGEVRRSDLAPLVLRYMDDEDEACRFWARWSATLLGDDKGLNGLKDLVESSATHREPAMQLALRAMNTPTAIDWLRELNRQPELTRLVVQATGVVGDPASIESWTRVGGYRYCLASLPLSMVRWR